MFELSDEDRETLSRLFGYVPEPEPLDQMLAAVEAIVQREQEQAEIREFAYKATIDRLSERLEFWWKQYDSMGLSVLNLTAEVDEANKTSESLRNQINNVRELAADLADEGASLVANAYSGSNVAEGLAMQDCARSILDTLGENRES